MGRICARIQRAGLCPELGFDPNGVDGITGKRTRRAVALFREKNKTGNSDAIDDDLIAALRAQVEAATAAVR